MIQGHEINSQMPYTLMMTILRKITDIEARLEKPIAQVTVAQAIRRYKERLGRETKKPENYDYLLLKFSSHFGKERNMADITAAEFEDFLAGYWNGTTLRQRLIQLKGFFGWVIHAQRKMNLPVFPNPCDLISVKPKHIETPEFISPEQIGILMRACPTLEHMLIFSIPLTSGLRVSELLALTPGDINGRVLKIRWPKSGRPIEHAVIPKEIASRLGSYIETRGIFNDQRIFNISRQGAGNMVTRKAKGFGLNISIHYLRKWCATFWNRLGEHGMEAFVLRHSPSALKDRYVAPLSIADVCAKQDKFLSPLFEKGADLWIP